MKHRTLPPHIEITALQTNNSLIQVRYLVNREEVLRTQKMAHIYLSLITVMTKSHLEFKIKETLLFALHSILFRLNLFHPFRFFFKKPRCQCQKLASPKLSLKLTDPQEGEDPVSETFINKVSEKIIIRLL